MNHEWPDRRRRTNGTCACHQTSALRSASSIDMTIYRLYVFLLDIAPPIWRRVELSSETSLAQLHKVLQAAMGWQDYHLHEFEIGGRFRPLRTSSHP